MAQGVVDDVGDDALEEPGVGEDVGQELVDVDADRRLRWYRGEHAGHDLVVSGRGEPWQHRAGREPGGVEQVVDEAGEPVGRFLDRGGELGPVRHREAQVRVAQAADGGLDRRQGGTQVVPDGGEQRGAQLGRLGPAPRLGGVGGHALAAQRDDGLSRNRLEQAAVRGRKRASATDEVDVGFHDDGGVGIVVPRRPVGRSVASDGVPAAVGAFEQCDRGQAECLTHLVQQAR